MLHFSSVVQEILGLHVEKFFTKHDDGKLNLLYDVIKVHCVKVTGSGLERDCENFQLPICLPFFLLKVEFGICSRSLFVCEPT